MWRSHSCKVAAFRSESTLKFGGELFMARIPPEIIDQVRNSVDIGDVISRYVQLHRSGKGFVGLCPFHEEQTPSFSVNEAKQFYYCFGCGRGGNVFQFLMELKHIPFVEAVSEVAEVANINLPSQYTEDAGQARAAAQMDTPAGKLISLHEQVTKLYHHILMNTPAGKPALNYLKKRGISTELIDEFDLGFAPDQRILKKFLQNKTDDYQLLRKSGLFIEDSTGELHDRFFNRVMYPLKDASGRVVGFSGRVIGEVPADTPKYLNSPETSIFNKRRLLFNLDTAQKEARHAGKIYLFEGFMDVISAYGAGVKNGVASMGTSLTEEQVVVLGRASQQLDVCYDGDSAGQNAIDRAMSLIMSHQPRGLQLRVVQLPAGLDPDDYVRQNGSESFVKYLENQEETSTDFYLRFYRMGKNLDSQNDLLSYIEQALTILAGLSSPLEQDMYLSRLAKEFDLDKETLQGQLRQISQRSTQATQQSSSLPGSSSVESPSMPTSIIRKPSLIIDRVELAERLLLRYMLHDREIWMKVTSVDNFHFVHENYQTLYLLATSFFSEHGEYSVAAFMDYVNDDKLRSILGEIEQLDVEEETDRKLIDDCIHLLLKQNPIANQIKKVKLQIQEASSLNNTELVTELTVKLISLLKKQQELKSGGK